MEILFFFTCKVVRIKYDEGKVQSARRKVYETSTDAQ